MAISTQEDTLTISYNEFSVRVCTSTGWLMYVVLGGALLGDT